MRGVLLLLLAVVALVFESLLLPVQKAATRRQVRVTCGQKPQADSEAQSCHPKYDSHGLGFKFPHWPQNRRIPLNLKLLATRDTDASHGTLPLVQASDDLTVLRQAVRDVERQIQDVEEEIKAAEESSVRATNQKDKQYYRNEKKQLRDKEKQLRDEKLKLRDEKQQLRDLEILRLKNEPMKLSVDSNGK